MPGTAAWIESLPFGGFLANTQLAVAEAASDGTLLYTNPALERLLDGESQRPLERLAVAEQRPALAQLLSDAGEEWRSATFALTADDAAEPRDYRVWTRRHSGRLLVVCEPLLEDAEQLNRRLLALNQELVDSQRTIASQQRDLARQNEQLLEADRLKDRFLALVSHDLRTPLTAILGYLELLERANSEWPAAQRRQLATVQRNAQRLFRLVDDLLIVAQVQAAEFTVSPTPVDLAGIAKAALELAQPQAAEKQIELRYHGLHSLPAVADSDRVHQLLTNLLSNAIKFTQPGGTATIRARCDDTFVLEVEDNGPGVPAAERERIFDPFIRGNHTGAATGTGLGLPIARAIAHAHGGTLTLQPGPAGGSLFRLTLPGRPT